jgi:hypothetical protein
MRKATEGLTCSSILWFDGETLAGRRSDDETELRDEWGTYILLERTDVIDHGIAYGARALR